MNLEQLIEEFELVTDTEEGLQKFKEYIINLAVRGKLTQQVDDDFSVEQTIEKVNKQKENLYQRKLIPKPNFVKLDPTIVSPFRIPDSWRWYSLDEISIYIQRGKSPKYSEEEKIPVVSQKCIQWDGFDLSRARFIDPRTIGKYQIYRFLQEGDLLWNSTGTGTIGRVNIFNNSNSYEKVVADSHVTIVRLGETLSNKYVMYWLASGFVQNDFEEIASGTTKQKELNTSTAKSFPVPLPPFEEQHRIVQKIETLFAQVDKLEQKVEQDRVLEERLQVAVLHDLQRAETSQASRCSWQRLTDHFEQIYRKPEHIDQLKQAILNEAVRGRLVPREENCDKYFDCLIQEIDNKRKELSSEGERRIKKGRDPVQEEEHLWSVPKHWRWLRFQDFILFIDYRGKTPKKTKSGVRLITAKNIRSGYIDFEPAEFIAEENYDNWMTRGIPKKGDLLFTTEAPLGKIAVIDFEKIFALAQRAINFRLLGNIDSYFIQYFIMSDIFQDILLDKATGMTATGIKSTILKKMPFPIPPFEEQKSIVQKVNKLFTWCDELKEKLSLSQQTDQRLLEALVKQALEDNTEESEKAKEATIYQMPKRRALLSEVAKLPGISTVDVQAGTMARILVLHEQYPDKKEHLGRTKMEKTVHVIESHFKIDHGREPKRMARGAADFQRLKGKVEFKAEKKGWFRAEEINGVVYYKRGTRFFEPYQKLDYKLGEKAKEVDRIINLFIPLTTRQAEVRQTVYAAWHDLIAFGVDPSDDEIVKWSSTEEYWTKEKEEIPKEEFYEAIEWLRTNDLVPDGKGKLSLKVES